MTHQAWSGHTIGGRYAIEIELGQGGMSTVYKATDPNLKRVVAIKLIHSHLSRDPEFVRRFEAEATVVAQLRHPNIIQVYDFNHDGEVYYIVFEFIPGETLQQRLKRLNDTNRHMEMDEVLKIAISIGDALTYAHKRNIIHRDVKPANVMINVQDEAILTDFGIVKIVGGAHHTATGAVLGTARYMSPEQIKGNGVDARSDIYSFGIMLYEMVSGHPPFNADSAMTLMMMHVKDPVPDMRHIRPNISPELIAVINKALAKEPEQRYQTMAQLVTDLFRIKTGEKSISTIQAKPGTSNMVVDSDLTELLESEEIALSKPTLDPEYLHPAPLKPETLSTNGLTANKNRYIKLGMAVLLIAIVAIYFALRSTGDNNNGNGSLIAIIDNSSRTAVPQGELPEVTPTSALPTVETTLSTPAHTETPESTNTYTPTPAPTPTPTLTPLPPMPPSSSSLNDTWTRPVDNMIMVFVPEGTYMMGSSEDNPNANADEFPQHQVTLSKFWIDRTEVTYAQFAIFVADTSYKTTAEEKGGYIYNESGWDLVDGVYWRNPQGPGNNFSDQDEHPVVLVTWDDALAYCSWAGAQLPSEAQWEYAARGPDGLVYPWGNEFDKTRLNKCDANCVLDWADTEYDDGYETTAPVASYSPAGDSWVGAADLSGNVLEWVADWYGEYSSTPQTDPIGPDMGVQKGLRGAAWSANDPNARGAFRNHIAPDSRFTTIGFRCVIVPDR